MITISKSETADSRTCDHVNISIGELLRSTNSHINDVSLGIEFAIKLLRDTAMKHDHTKLSHLDLFHKEFKTGFKTKEWWKMHQEKERHHLKDKEYVQSDVNIFDILEMIIDGVMAGMARSGKYKKEEIPDLGMLLNKAYDNTIKLFLDNVKTNKED